MNEQYSQFTKQLLEDYAAQRTELLEEQLSKLQAQLIEHTAQMERLQNILNAITLDVEAAEGGVSIQFINTVWKNLIKDQNPSPDFASKVLRLAAIQFNEYHRFKGGWMPWMTELIESFTTDERRLLGVEE